MAFSSSLSFSPQFLAGQTQTATTKATPLTSVRFRRSPPISAAYATAERTRSHIAQSQSLYDVLGVQIGATCPEIKAAYRRLARVSHPDVTSRDSAGDEFMRIHAAYNTLSDPEKRADYDRTIFWKNQPRYTMMAGVSRFSGKTRRSWETDQCW